MVRGEREQLENVCCATTSPSVTGHRIAIDCDGKPPEELEFNFLHYWMLTDSTSSGQCAQRNVRGTVSSVA